MKKLFDNFLIWLAKILQPIVEKKFVLKDTWELEKVENKGTRLPHVLFENKSLVINNFFIPIQLVRMRFLMYNKGNKVGKILFDGPVKLSPRSKKSISMEVRLNHITAIFNMLRFIFTTSNIQMTIKGEVQLKILGLDFFIPVNDVLDLPKSKVQMIINTIENRTSISTIPFEEVEDDEIDDTSIENQNPALINSAVEISEITKEENQNLETLSDIQKKANPASDEHNPL